MRVTLTFPDDVADLYAIDAAKHQLSFEDRLSKQLAAFAHVGLTDRALVVMGADLATLTDRLGTFILGDAQDLIRKVTALRDLKVGEVRVNLSPAQIEEIRVRAEKNGIAFAAEFESIVRQAVDGLGAYV